MEAKNKKLLDVGTYLHLVRRGYLYPKDKNFQTSFVSYDFFGFLRYVVIEWYCAVCSMCSLLRKDINADTELSQNHVFGHSCPISILHQRRVPRCGRARGVNFAKSNYESRQKKPNSRHSCMFYEVLLGSIV